MARTAVTQLRELYPGHTIHDVDIDIDACAGWVERNASDMSIVVSLGFQFADCMVVATPQHTETWFVIVDGCGSGSTAPNMVCGAFDESQVAYAAGYLAGLTTKAKFAGVVGGIPVPAVKRLFNGFRLGLEASCPACRLEGGFVNSFFHGAHGEAMAGELVASGADVLFGCGGFTGTMAIVRGAELGAMVIGVDVDEFVSTFAQGRGKEVSGRLLSSATKKCDMAIQIAVSKVLGTPAGAAVEGITQGVLLLDYASNAVGLADCHTACGFIGTTTWQNVKRVERELGLGLTKVRLTSDGSMPAPSSGVPNTFLRLANLGGQPAPRAQHAMASFSSAWQSHIAIFGGVGANGPLNDFWFYEVETAKWVKGDNVLTQGTPPPPLAKACAVGLGLSVFIFGGRTATNGQSGKVYSFTDQPSFLGFTQPTDPAIRYEWALVPAEGTAPEVEGPGCAPFNATCFLVFGGRAAFVERASVHRFCLEGPSGRWTRMWPPVGNVGDLSAFGPPVREIPGAAVVAGPSVGLANGSAALVVVGGASGGRALVDAWAFDLEHVSWTRLPDLPRPSASQPLVFSVREPIAAGRPARDVISIQLTSAETDLGMGAIILDLESRAWQAQLGAFAVGSAPPPGSVAQVAGVRASDRTWLFGGLAASDFMQDLYVAEFAPQKMCGAGQEADGIACVNCSIGYASLGGTARCSPCPAGRAVAVRGASLCALCEPGRIAQEGQASCMPCPAGRSTENRYGEDACVECGRGRYAASGMPECAVCGPGSYGSGWGNTNCTPCAGQLTTEYMGASEPELCICPAGTYRPLQEGEGSLCSPCPEGMRCPIGSDMRFMGNRSQGPFPLVEPGYMTLATDTLEVYACLPPEHCPGGGPATCGPSLDNSKVACGACEAHAFESGLECQPCKDTQVPSAVPFGLLVLFFILAVILLTIFISRDLFMQTHAKLNLLVLVGLAVTGIQTLGIFEQLAIEWPEPIASVLRSIDLLSFNLKVAQIGCVMGGDPVAKFVFRQSIAPCGAVLVCLTLVAKRQLGASIRVGRQTVNSVGTLFNVFFISILISCISPLICYTHPGTAGSSMRSSPSILCFDGGAHAAMVIVGLLALLAVPLPFAALTAFGTLRYPVVVARANADGADFLQATGFLFFKFRPERYYYGVVLVLRSLFICLVPVVIRDTALVQVLAVCSVLIFFAQAQQHLKPWREWPTNIVDGGLSGILVLLLITGASNSGLQADPGALRALCTAVFVALSLLALCSIAAGVYESCRTHTYYHHFICHHKEDAGAQSRLLKLRLEARTGHNIFIDSDNLKNLDNLFDILKKSVGQLIVYLTCDTLCRPWCAGEITTAFKTNRVKVVAIMTPSFRPPSEGELSKVQSYLDLSSSCLSQYGLMPTEIQESFRRLLGRETPRVTMQATGGGITRFHDLVESLVRPGWPPNGDFASAAPPLAPVPDRAGMLVISVESQNDEAVAAAGIIISKVQTQAVRLGVTGVCPLCNHPDDDVATLTRVCVEARAVLVLLSAGSLLSWAQLVTIVEIMESHDGAAASPPSAAGLPRGSTSFMADFRHVIPVSLPGFHFPTEDYYKSVLPHIMPEHAEAVAKQVRALFRLIAAPFSTHASDQVLDAQAQELLARLAATFGVLRSDSRVAAGHRSLGIRAAATAYQAVVN